MKLRSIISKLSVSEYFLFLLCFAFSSLLMWKTFRISPTGNLQIASRLWSDFAATIPLIRSFSYGANLPPQYPIFAGPPIRYHFIFFAVVGFLEKVGIPIDWAFNSLSIISFFLLLAAIYLLGKFVFKNKAVGIISVLLFLFNGSFGFLEFFKKHSLSVNTLTDIFRNTDFSSFGPYDGKIVSAFWSLNIFTNQRHLALAYTISLTFVLIIYLAYKNPEKLTSIKGILLGMLLGIFPFIHLSAFIMSGISLVVFFLIFPKVRRQIFLIGTVALIIALPQYIYMGNAEVKTKLFQPGYLVTDLTIASFLKYWLLNLGLTILLAPLGFLLAQKNQRKILIPFLVFFVIGNLFQFTPDMPTNHKFFNFFVIGLNFFTAYFLVRLWKAGFIGKIAIPFLILLLTLTGIIDIFPIFNDRFITLEDIPNNTTATFIYQNTPKDSVFLNATYLYDPASLAGRKIYLGWPYFAWGIGYDTTQRHQIMQEVLASTYTKTLCKSLKQEGIDFIEIQNPTNLEDTPINYEFFENNFEKIFFDPKGNFSIYSPKVVCDRITSI